MSATLLISLRETLEASLIVGIVLTVLTRTEHRRLHCIAWSGAAAGVLMSLLLATILQKYTSGFEGRTEQIYEGTMMLVATALLTWMILWLLREGRTLHSVIASTAERHLARGELLGIFFLTFFGVLREGIEIVIFLEAAILQSASAFHHIGVIAGMALAIGLTWLLLRGAASFSLRSFFSVTSALLVLFAAGLVAHGTHELQEAMLLPFLTYTAWDTSSILSEQGFLGSLFKGLFGYNDNPSMLEVMSYATYLCAISFFWRVRTK